MGRSLSAGLGVGPTPRVPPQPKDPALSPGTPAAPPTCALLGLGVLLGSAIVTSESCWPSFPLKSCTTTLSWGEEFPQSEHPQHSKPPPLAMGGGGREGMDVIWGPKCPTAHTHPGWGQLVVISSVCTGVRLGGHSRSPAQGGLRGDNAISTGWGDRLGPLPSAQAVPHLQGTWLGAARGEARRAEGALSVGGRTLWSERGEQSRMRAWGAGRCQSWHFPPPF